MYIVEISKMAVLNYNKHKNNIVISCALPYVCTLMVYALENNIYVQYTRVFTICSVDVYVMLVIG